MKITGKIGFIGGGMMAEALVRGIIQSELAAAGDIVVVEPVEARRKSLARDYGVAAVDQSTAVAECAVVILAVKPQVMAAVLDQYQQILNADQLIISIAAGIPLSLLEKGLVTGCRLIRVMPNTPALVLEGASALSGGVAASSEDLETASAIFNAIGSSTVLPESYLDAVTGLSGSGPAYVYTFIEGLIDAGLKVGLSRGDSEKLVLQTVLGSVKLAMETERSPAELKAMVTSPGGTTIAGLHELEKGGMRATLMNCVERACERSRELGKIVAG